MLHATTRVSTRGWKSKLHLPFSQVRPSRQSSAFVSNCKPEEPPTPSPRRDKSRRERSDRRQSEKGRKKRSGLERDKVMSSRAQPRRTRRQPRRGVIMTVVTATALIARYFPSPDSQRPPSHLGREEEEKRGKRKLVIFASREESR